MCDHQNETSVKSLNKLLENSAFVLQLIDFIEKQILLLLFFDLMVKGCFSIYTTMILNVKLSKNTSIFANFLSFLMFESTSTERNKIFFFYFYQEEFCRESYASFVYLEVRCHTNLDENFSCTSQREFVCSGGIVSGMRMQ